MALARSHPVGTPLRADARRNRKLVLDAATQVFRDLGPDAPMETIARTAGVGVGTLYRRFPDRDALVLAVVEEDLTLLLQRTQEAGQGDGTHWDRLLTALRLAEQLGSSVRLVGQLPPDLATRVRTNPTVRRTQLELFAAVDGLLRAAQDEGSVRSDIGTGDIAQLFSILLEMGLNRGSVPSARARAIVFDGLRPQSGSVLPGRPLEPGDVTFSPIAAPEGATG